jgi:hypothetical protein
MFSEQKREGFQALEEKRIRDDVYAANWPTFTQKLEDIGAGIGAVLDTCDDLVAVAQELKGDLNSRAVRIRASVTNEAERTSAIFRQMRAEHEAVKAAVLQWKSDRAARAAARAAGQVRLSNLSVHLDAGQKQLRCLLSAWQVMGGFLAKASWPDTRAAALWLRVSEAVFLTARREFDILTMRQRSRANRVRALLEAVRDKPEFVSDGESDDEDLESPDPVVSVFALDDVSDEEEYLS